VLKTVASVPSAWMGFNGMKAMSTFTSIARSDGNSKCSYISNQLSYKPTLKNIIIHQTPDMGPLITHLQLRRLDLELLLLQRNHLPLLLRRLGLLLRLAQHRLRLCLWLVRRHRRVLGGLRILVLLYRLLLLGLALTAWGSELMITLASWRKSERGLGNVRWVGRLLHRQLS
jgi:hypothetical protein